MDGKTCHFSLWNSWMSVSQSVCASRSVSFPRCESTTNGQLSTMSQSLPLSLFNSVQLEQQHRLYVALCCGRFSKAFSSSSSLSSFFSSTLSSCPAFLSSPAALSPVSKGQRLKGWFPFGKQPGSPPAAESLCVCVCVTSLEEKMS